MLKSEQYKRDPVDETTPRFPTDAEIEAAERLRHQIEERYLRTFGQDPPTIEPPGTDR